MSSVNEITDALRGCAFAHRGLHELSRGVPENSLAAAERAVSKGFGIELDVHLCADGVPVVIHDGDLRRACGVAESVGAASLERIRSLTLFNTRERIPTLAEFLSCVGGRVPLLIELKSPSGRAERSRLCQAIADVLRGYGGLFLVQSFDPRLLAAFRRVMPRVPRGQLATRLRENGERISPPLDFALRNLLVNVVYRPDFVSYEFSKRSALPAFARRILAARPELGWTIRTPSDFAAARRQGVIPIFEGFIPE